MSAKKAVVGALTGGGGTAGGYTVAQNQMNKEDASDSPETKPAIVGRARAKPTRKILDLLNQDSVGKDFGKPISSLGGSANPWWIKAYHKYVLGVQDSDKIDGVGGSELRDSWDSTNKPEQLKDGCEKLTEKDESDSDSLEKAKKWCVTYKTVSSMFEDGNTGLTSEADDVWITKYDNAEQDANFKYKDFLKKAKENFEQQIKEGNKNDKSKKKAMRGFCSMAMDGSTEDLKGLVEKYCSRATTHE